MRADLLRARFFGHECAVSDNDVSVFARAVSCARVFGRESSVSDAGVSDFARAASYAR